MAVTAIHIEELAGETRAVAMAGNAAVSVFVDSAFLPISDTLGTISHARLVSSAPAQGGHFLELASGAPAFLRGHLPKGTSEGSQLNVRIAAEARDEKSARVQLAKPDATSPTPLDYWIDGLPGAGRNQIVDTADSNLIDAVFDDAICAHATLPGGGTLHLTRTCALTAMDIDTAGRNAAGNAAERANAINLEAAREAARQLSLRRIGGLGVLDCIAPISRSAGGDIKSALLAAFRSTSSRKAAALAPSPFGLMEVSLAWTYMPLDNLYGSGDTPYALAMAGLRQLEREAGANRTASLVLELPGAAYMHITPDLPALRNTLNAGYGARLDVISGASQTLKVHTK